MIGICSPRRIFIPNWGQWRPRTSKAGNERPGTLGCDLGPQGPKTAVFAPIGQTWTNLDKTLCENGKKTAKLTPFLLCNAWTNPVFCTFWGDFRVNWDDFRVNLKPFNGFTLYNIKYTECNSISARLFYRPNITPSTMAQSPYS